MSPEMRYIFTVYKNGSFVKAAEELYMTQPALSIAVQRVEKQIGMPLFDRTQKPLRLTEAGRLYIKKYMEISDLERELEEQINDISTLKKGTLRIGGSHYFNSYILPPVLKNFTDSYPGIDLSLVEAGSNELLRMLYEHTIDITFNCNVKPKDSFRRVPSFIDTILLAVPKSYDVNQGLEAYALTSEEILIDKKHLDFSHPAISLSVFQDSPFILLSKGNDLYKRSQQMFDHEGIQANVKLQVSQLVTAWHLACSGLGITFISDYLINSPNENVLFYKIASPEAIRVFDITMSDRHYVSNAMKAFQVIFHKHYGLHLPDRKL